MSSPSYSSLLLSNHEPEPPMAGWHISEVEAKEIDPEATQPIGFLDNFMNDDHDNAAFRKRYLVCLFKGKIEEKKQK
jgi:hypothetical protein